MGLEEVLKTVGVAAESMGKIRLGGVVGKTSTAVIALFGVFAIVAWKMSDPLVIGLVAAVIFLVYFAGVMAFALKNPGAALLEGAELVQWQQVEMAAKGIGSPPSAPAVPDPTAPRELPGPELDRE